MQKSTKMTMEQKRSLTGWAFLIPAALLIFIFCFYPMFQAILISMKKGTGVKMTWAGFSNYIRITKDNNFYDALFNTFFYLIIQVPIMLLLALVLAQMLNNPKIKFKGLFRTLIFLPCATSLISYSMIFKAMFAVDGFVNLILTRIGLPAVPWFINNWTAKIVVILALLWRWTGYNMVFYLAGLQNIEKSIYEAARIDGASAFRQFTHITIPLLKPTILLTAIMSTSGTLQLFDESYNFTGDNASSNTIMTLSHYIYKTCFVGKPNFGYASALSVFILITIAILTAIQMKVGDKRD